MSETWKTVSVCPAYEVSSLGRIRRCAPGKRTKIGNILKTNGNVRYRTVTLVQGGVRTYIPVHVLVCQEFHGPRPTPRHEAAHLNGDSHDNREDNLTWSTRLENEAHKVGHGTLVLGESVFGAKLTEQSVREIRRLHTQGYGFTDLGRRFGVYYTTIRRIVQRHTWKHVAD
jgi:HNH endonuclease/Helix-turn-helix domain/NUMOD4 motif